MSVTISKSTIKGTIHAPPSKSYTHRALICGLLSSGQTIINNHLVCDDTSATLKLSRMMGAKINHNKNLTITGADPLRVPDIEMDCHGSGTTLRLFTAISALTDGRCVLTGDSSLLKRPIGELLDALYQLGIRASSINNNDRPPVEIYGNVIEGATVRIRGDISSQYISGLLFACSKGSNESTIEITTQLESQPYVEMTLEVMKHFGVTAEPSDNWEAINIPGNQNYRVSQYDVPGDYSSAAFLMVAGALAGKVKISGLRNDCLQGDAQVVGILEEIGISISHDESGITVSKSEPMPSNIDAANIPDLVPVLSVLASPAEGQTRIFNAKRLRYKESNRLTTITMELRKMGADLRETNDGIIIEGPTRLHGAVINPHGDHRIAMACTVASLVSKHSTTIHDIECVKKSYPNFIEDIISLCANITRSPNMNKRRRME